MVTTNAPPLLPLTRPVHTEPMEFFDVAGPMMTSMPIRSRSSSSVTESRSEHSTKELDRAKQVGRRLADELLAAINALPPEHRSIRAMATYLNVDANVCQRAIAASQLSTEPIEALRKAPGIAGLRLLHAGLEKKNIRRALLTALDAAVAQFALLIQDFGGSHAKLQRRLMQEQEQVIYDAEPIDAIADEQLRRRMFQSTAAWLGSQLHTYAGIFIIRSVPGSSEFVEGCKVQAYIGHRSRMSGLPLVMNTWYRSGEAKDKELASHPDNLTLEMASPAEAANLLPEFSTNPAPIVSARANQDGSVYIVDPAASSKGVVDAVVFSHFPQLRHPRLCVTPACTFCMQITQPCRRMIYDVWVEKKLATGAIPSAGFGWIGEPTRRGEGLPWYHRLPGPASLELLTPETFRASDAWPQHAAATRRAFELQGSSWGDFVGYRLEQTYPAWGTGAVIVLDYAPLIEAEAAARNA